ncbi:hypothetical protein [Bifidobacterium crudilactis]|jgi:hypothetical protein|uniref:hypothetical protein n=1 Tax=Bifidobacterium crudilactis TaxID=327277 RepID=UPI0023551C29|nr:hypothetical protein [Bifidobacterium crudilactis]MCI1868509.1 hypothetical protein [Bifidobacterium crudilactis]
MTQEYTPTDNGIAQYATRGMSDIGVCSYGEAKRRWSRWLAAHDAQIRAEARDEWYTSGCMDGVKSSDIQEAYEQGRTAEPTEAEIEAGAVSLAEILNSLSLGNEKYSGITVGQVVRELFAAARKAVKL